MIPHIRRATMADAIVLAPRLREADKREIKAVYGIAPEVLLPLSVQSSGETWTMTGDAGEPLGLFGVSGVKGFPSFGMIWMMGTDDLFDNPLYRRKFIRLGASVIEMLHERYPLLGNHIDARNEKHLHWLRKLGFSLLRTIPDYGVEKLPFHEFAKLKV